MNNRKIKVENHFERKVNYCILNEEGRNIFFKSFSKSYGNGSATSQIKEKDIIYSMIKIDCYKLIKFIMEDKEFIPYSLKAGY